MSLFIAIIFAWLGGTANAFTCTGKGLFENTDNNDCTTFVYCSGANSNPSIQNCNQNTYYWPEGQACSSQYNCNTKTMFDNKNPCLGLSGNAIPDRSSTDCTQYLSCGSNYFWTGIESVKVQMVTSQQCPSGTSFRLGYGCDNTYRCAGNYDCTTEGYFENPGDCLTFIKCSTYNGYTLDFNNYYVAYQKLYSALISCPAGTKFNPSLHKCDSFYQCDGNDPHEGVDPCSVFNYANPFVPNKFDASASSYISCQYINNYDNSGAINIISEKPCPAYTSFSPLLGKCYGSFDLNEGCSKDPCISGPGRYPDLKSGHCDTFIECRDLSTSLEVYQPVYTVDHCTVRTQFSPISSKCERQYVCPTIPVDYCYEKIPTTTTAMPATTTPPPPVPSG